MAAQNIQDPPSILLLAQLALDVYDGKDDDDLRKSHFNKDWIAHFTVARNVKNILDIKIDEKLLIECEKEGLFARVYGNKNYAYRILAIRGTEPTSTGDLVADIRYFMNIEIKQFEALKNVYQILEVSIKDRPIQFVCGHSLGGILAKLLSPISKQDTCAFNSPGVLENLVKIMKKFFLGPKQKIVTYIAKRDLVGEYAHHADIGKRIFVATTNDNKISKFETEDPRKLNELPELTMKFHSMRDFFIFMHKSNYGEVKLKPIKIHYHNERYYCLKAKMQLVSTIPANWSGLAEIFRLEKEVSNKCTLYYELKKQDK